MFGRFWSGLAFGLGAGSLGLAAFVVAIASLLPNSIEPVSYEVNRSVKQPVTWTLMVGGDVMLGRQVERNIDRYGATWPFDGVAERLAQADLTLVNLESPFLISGQTTANDSLILRGDPSGSAGLTNSGIDMVSLANNHIPDMGRQGLLDTQQILAAAGIGFAGAGETAEEAGRAYLTRRADQDIAILSYTYGVNFDRPGVVYAVAKPDQVAADIASVRTDGAEVVIVMVHFGTEYAAIPTNAQKEFAHAAIDAGASAVLGHHPHVPQPLEVYQDRPIIYSLGNLVFDQAPGGGRDHSAVAELTFTGNQPEKIQLLPYHIYNYGQPRWLAEGGEYVEILTRFNLPTGSISLKPSL